MDMASAFNNAKKKAWQIQKLPGESDEEFRWRKKKERQKKNKGIAKSPYADSIAEGYDAAEDNQ